MNKIEVLMMIMFMFIFGAETFYMGYSFARDMWFKKKLEGKKEKENK